MERKRDATRQVVIVLTSIYLSKVLTYLLVLLAAVRAARAVLVKVHRDRSCRLQRRPEQQLSGYHLRTPSLEQGVVPPAQLDAWNSRCDSALSSCLQRCTNNTGD